MLQKVSTKLFSFSTNHLIAHSTVSSSILTLSLKDEVVYIGVLDVLECIYSLNPSKKHNFFDVGIMLLSVNNEE